MSERTPEQIAADKQEFDALAPTYLEILDSLSDNEALKFAFYSMDFFQDLDRTHRMRTLMEEHDPDAERWESEIIERSRERREQERRLEREQHLGFRADLEMSNLIEFDPSGTPALKNDARSRIINSFDTGNWWYPELAVFRDENETVINYAIYGRSNGATIWMIGTDAETNQLCFGSRVHNLTYDPQRQAVIGRLGSGRYKLDSMGRSNVLEEEKASESL